MHEKKTEPFLKGITKMNVTQTVHDVTYDLANDRLISKQSMM